MQLQTVLKQKLAVDWKAVDGVTLFGAGDRASETAMVLRGNFGGVDLTNLPVDEKLPSYDGIQLREGTEWQGSPLILATPSDQEWFAGTSLEAVKESLDLLAGRQRSRSSSGLDEDAAKERNSAAAMFALDMKKLNGELQFEADFSRAIQRSWFLIGFRDDLVEATLMVESPGAFQGGELKSDIETMDESDEDLLARCQQGSIRAFESLLQRCRRTGS